MPRISLSRIAVCCLVFGCAGPVLAAPGESAVITLVFPPGARGTGMGETFTAIADDASATYFNPAGLGQPPMSNSWHYYLENKDYRFTAIASKHKKAFDINEKIWVGTQRGLLRFNGKVWETSDTYILEKDDDLGTVARKFFDVGTDEAALRKIEMALAKENRVWTAHRGALAALLTSRLDDSTKKKLDIDDFAFSIASIPKDERDTTKIFGMIADKVDSARADRLAAEIMHVLASKDRELADMVELKVPFALAVKDSVTCMVVDESDQLWAGTTRGLWRHDGNTWKCFTSIDGLPSDTISNLAIGPNGQVAVGTDAGLAVLTDGAWKAYGPESGLPDTAVQAVTFNKAGVVYVGTAKGLACRRDTGWVLYDTASGLLSESVTALFFDSRGKLWIGGQNGVTLYDEVSWKRYRFPESIVYTFAEYQPGRIWIGTNRGAITYKAGKTRTDANGKMVEDPPEWKPFHSKNALKGDDARSINVYGKDVWLVTDQAVNHYDRAQRQVLLFWEPLLPALGLKDLWHSYFSFILPTEDWGTFGLSINYINMGINEWTDELGRLIGRARSWEGVFGLSYGFGLTEGLSLGLNAKFVESVLAPISSSGEGTGTTIAFDASILKRDLIKNFDVGFMAQNMGPSIFYVKKENSDPIPFTLRLGLNYRAIQNPLYDLKVALDLDREFVKSHLGDTLPDPFYEALFTSTQDDPWQTEVEEINAHLGLEFWYVQFLALRTGFLFDYIGERYELTFGIGLKYGNMIFDWSYIHSPEGFLKQELQWFNPDKEGATGVRNGQWRASLLTKF